MQLIKATVLAKALGIRRQTVSDWCRRDPELSIRKGRDYWVRVELFKMRTGLDMIGSVAKNTGAQWVKAVQIAAMSGISRRTMATWCMTRPGFASRIGRNWYVDVANTRLEMPRTFNMSAEIKPKKLSPEVRAARCQTRQTARTQLYNSRKWTVTEYRKRGLSLAETAKAMNLSSMTIWLLEGCL